MCIRDRVEGIGQTVSKHYQRQGVVESIDRKSAEDKINKINPNAAILNTKDKTRTLRIFPQIMEHFIETGKPLEYIDFHSSAVSHQEVDNGRTDSQKNLVEMDKLVLDYAAQRTKTGIIPWKKLGSLAQKIGIERDTLLTK